MRRLLADPLDLAARRELEELRLWFERGGSITGLDLGQAAWVRREILGILDEPASDSELETGRIRAKAAEIHAVLAPAPRSRPRRQGWVVALPWVVVLLVAVAAVSVFATAAYMNSRQDPPAPAAPGEGSGALER